MRTFNRFISIVLLTLLATQTFADVSAGKDIVTRKGCAGCHGGSSLEGGSDSANLSVLTSDELIDKLTAYRKSNINGQMQTITKNMTDQNIADIAAYIVSISQQITITSVDNFTANEGMSSVTHTLIASDTTAVFSIIENPSNLFNLNGATLSFNGTNTDYESATKTYTVKIKATTGTTVKQNAEQTITVTLNDIDDTAPTNIQLSNTTLVIGQPAGTYIGTLSANDVDTDNALTFTVNNTNHFKITNKNELKSNQPFTSKDEITITITASDGTQSTDKDFTIQVITNQNPAKITNTSSLRVDENMTGTVLTITATNEPSSETLTYSISGTDYKLFNINGAIITFKAAPDFEEPSDEGANNVYDLVLEVNDTLSTTRKNISITVDNIVEQTLTIANQTRNIAENSAKDTRVGDPLETTGSPTKFSIIAGNDAGLFKINNSGQIQVATAGLDHETSTTYTLTVQITGTDAAEKSANITININNVADTPIEHTPTVSAGEDITTSINKIVTLTATGVDPDDDILSYTWTAPTGITLNNANTKTASFTTTAAMEGSEITFSVSVSDGTHSASDSVIVKVNNAEVVAQAVRKESKAASKTLLSRASKTVMGRLSYLRHKQNKKSGFNANGFVNGIQVSFIDPKFNTISNQVLNANKMSSTIKTPTHKINRWDTWSSAKVVIGKSNGKNNNKTKLKLQSLNVGIDRHIDTDKIFGFTLSFGKEDRTATGSDFAGDVDTTQYTLSSYGALELGDKGSIEAVIGLIKGKHKVNTDIVVNDQDSNGYFASVAYRADGLQIKALNLSPFIRYDISRIKMKANDILTNNETSTDEALAIGVDLSHQSAYQDGTLNRFINLEYKSDIRRDGNDYLSKNAEQEVGVKLGLNYKKGDTDASINYERVQSTNGKAHSDGIEGTILWKF